MKKKQVAPSSNIITADEQNIITLHIKCTLSIKLNNGEITLYYVSLLSLIYLVNIRQGELHGMEHFQR